MSKLQNSTPIKDIDFTQYDIIFISGGWGGAYDLGFSELLGEKISEAYYSSKAIMANAVVYFDFDQYTLSSKSIQTLRSIAQVMEDNKDLEITVSGHADERGTREYNLALGQRRGEAVRDYLLLNGISKNRITVKSYGEEYPLVKGSNESSWAKNRRAEIN